MGIEKQEIDKENDPNIGSKPMKKWNIPQWSSYPIVGYFHHL